MRILLIYGEAPGLPILNTIPELRSISSSNWIYPLSGADVTVARVYETVDRYKFDAIHFAIHGDETGLALPSGELMDSETISQVARIAGATTLIFMSCESSFHATYAVSHGVDFAFSANVDLADEAAGRFTVAMYNHLQNGHSWDWLGAYRVASNGDGVMAWTMNPQLAQEALAAYAMMRATRSSWPTKYTVIFAVAAALSLLVSGLALYNALW